MLRDYRYLIAGLLAITAGVLWIGMQRADFEVLGASEGVPPGTRTLTVRVKNTSALKNVRFAIDPDEVSIIAQRAIGDGTLVLLLDSPLQPGKTYNLRAAAGLSGSVRLRVRALHMRFVPAVFQGPEDTPALLLTANAPIPATEVSIRDQQGDTIPTQPVSLSPTEVLYILKSPAALIEVPFQRGDAKVIEGTRMEIVSPEFSLRESITEEQGGRFYVRLRFSHWIEGRLENAAQYIKLANGIPFSMEARGIDLYLYPETRPSGPFRVEIQAGFPGSGKEKLRRSESLLLSPTNVSMLGWYQPYLHFLPPGAPILFQVGAQQAITVEVWKVLPQNARLFFYHKADGSWMNYNTDTPIGDWGWGGWWNSSDMELYAERIRKANYDLSLLKKIRRGSQTLYAVGEDLPPGIYAVEVRAGEDIIRNWFVVSAFGLIARRGTEGVHVWAVSHATQEPLRGVELELWGAAGQSLGRTTTDRRGYAFLRIEKDIQPEGIWATWAGEPNYLPLRGLRPGRWTFETGGIDPQAKGLLAYFAAARTLFRPGESLELAGAFRTAQMTYPTNLRRVWGRLRDPRGQILWSGAIPCEADGSWQWNYTLPLTATTGHYQLELLQESDEELIATFPLQVEAFRPNRLSINLFGDIRFPQFTLSAQVAYLYGAVATGVSGEVSLRWKPTSPVKDDDYIWTPAIPSDALSLSRGTAWRTDARGEAQSTFELPKGYGYGELRAVATFMDDEGHPNKASAALPCATQPYIVGMRKLPAYVQGGKTLSIPLRALKSANLKPPAEPISVRVDVIEKQYEPLLVELPWGGFRQEYRPVERLFHSGVVELRGGEGVISFVPQRGQYEIRVWAPEQAFPTMQTVEAWDWGGESLLLSDSEGGIEIRPQKPSYSVGDKAHLLLKLPMPGRVLITVERERVFYSEWLSPKGDATEVEIPIKSDYLPGVYVHVIALHEAGAPFRVSRGLMYLPVESSAMRAQVQVEAPERTLPGSTITLRVKSDAPRAQLILTGVDVGILPWQRSDIASPFDFFYQKRAHTVKVSEQLPYTVPWSARIIGGDGEMPSGLDGEDGNLSDKASGMLERSEKLTSFFWAALKTDEQGLATVQVPMPAFTGRIRWRAYVLQEKRFGMGEAFTTVTMPVVGRLSLPLAMSEGDEVNLTLSLQNTTDAPQSGQWRLEIRGEGLQVSAQSGAFTLPAGKAERRPLTLRATASMGKAQVRLFVQERLVQEQEVLLRPPSGIQREVKTYTLAPGEEIVLTDPAPDLLRRRARLVGGSVPAVQHAGALWALVHFPHGCAEQITSQAFASLTASDWLEKIAGLSPDTQKAHIRHTLRKLQTYQTTDGGFGYWGKGTADPWLSVYVAHFLYEAKKAGYAEAAPLYERAVQRERTHLSVTPPSSRTQAYRALLLARDLKDKVKAAFPAVAEVNQISDPVIRALWRGAFAQVGLPLPNPPSALPLPSKRQHNEELISATRDLALFIYGESFVSEAQRSPLLAEAQKRLLNDIGSLSTQEASWLLLALTQMGTTQPTHAVVQYSGSQQTHSGTIWAQALPEKGELRITNKGATPLYVAYIVEGIPARPVASVSAGFRLSSAVRPEKGTALRLGDQGLWTIEIEAEPHIALPMQNLALTIPLPAGWLIENQRLTEGESLSTEGVEVIHTDQRDDRILLYLTLERRKATITLPIRITLSGRYQVPSIGVLAMYEPGLYGSTAAQTVNVGAVPQ